MADGSKIEWTDATWNVVTGCSVISPGCTNCYAMRLAGTRLRHHWSRQGLTQETKAGPVWTGETRLNDAWLTQPLSWTKPRDIFVCAHGDLFHAGVTDEQLDHVFAVMALGHWHRLQVLTKRSARMRAYLSARDVRDRVIAAAQKLVAEGRARAIFFAFPWPLPNVWLGVSAEDQRRADERIPDLLETPAAVRWVSAEPLLGLIDFRHIAPTETGYLNALTSNTGPNLDWIVVGGESGPGARPEVWLISVEILDGMLAIGNRAEPIEVALIESRVEAVLKVAREREVVA